MKFKEPLLWIAFLTVGFAGVAMSARTAENSSAQTETGEQSLETFIPKDHLLIPVELANADKLEGLIGDSGIVDLYQVPQTEGGKAQLVGRRFRLLRAPLNPNSFAVLLKDAEADRFLLTTGPYLASVRSPKEPKHELAKSSRPGPRIEYQSQNEGAQ